MQPDYHFFFLDQINRINITVKVSACHLHQSFELQKLVLHLAVKIIICEA